MKLLIYKLRCARRLSLIFVRKRTHFIVQQKIEIGTFKVSCLTICKFQKTQGVLSLWNGEVGSRLSSGLYQSTLPSAVKSLLLSGTRTRAECCYIHLAQPWGISRSKPAPTLLPCHSPLSNDCWVYKKKKEILSEWLQIIICQPGLSCLRA